MGQTFQALTGVLGIDTSKWTKGFKGAGKTATKFKSLATNVFSFAAKAAKIAAVALAAAAAATTVVIVKAIKEASKLEETMNKFNVVFGESAVVVKEWSDEFAKSVGRSREEMASFMAGAQDLFVPLGFASEAATELSKGVTQLAVDLASFNNKADADVMTDLAAALTGSGEVMKKYGVILSETAVKQELLNTGFDPKTVTNQQKVQARYNIILRGTTAAQGDAIRSAGSFANQMKRLHANIANAMATLGGIFLPIATKIVSALGAVADEFDKWVGNVDDFNTGAGGAFMAWMTELAMGAGRLVVELFAQLWELAKDVLKAFKDIVVGEGASMEQFFIDMADAVKKTVDWMIPLIKTWFDGARVIVQTLAPAVRMAIHLFKTLRDVLLSMPGGALIGSLLGAESLDEQQRGKNLEAKLNTAQERLKKQGIEINAGTDVNRFSVAGADEPAAGTPGASPEKSPAQRASEEAERLRVEEAGRIKAHRQRQLKGFVARLGEEVRQAHKAGGDRLAHAIHVAGMEAAAFARRAIEIGKIGKEELENVFKRGAERVVAIRKGFIEERDLAADSAKHRESQEKRKTKAVKDGVEEQVEAIEELENTRNRIRSRNVLSRRGPGFDTDPLSSAASSNAVLAAGAGFQRAEQRIRQKSPLVQLGLRIRLLQGQLNALSINLRRGAGALLRGGVLGGNVDSVRNQMLEQLKKLVKMQEDELRRRRRLRLRQFRRFQASRAEAARRRREERDVFGTPGGPTHTGPTSTLSARGASAGLRGSLSFNGPATILQDNGTVNLTMTFTERITPESARRITKAVDEHLRRAGKDSFGRSALRSGSQNRR